jgi:hypothetical protein
MLLLILYDKPSQLDWARADITDADVFSIWVFAIIASGVGMHSCNFERPLHPARVPHSLAPSLGILLEAEPVSRSVKRIENKDMR